MLVITLGGNDVGSDGPRDVAQAFVSAVNDQQQPDTAIFCEAFVQDGAAAANALPGDVPAGLPNIPIKATLADVTETGDTATAVVGFEVGTGGQLIKGDYHLDIQKENGDWKICGVELGDIDVPGLGG